MVLTLCQAGHTHYTPGNWFVYCVVLFFSFTISLTPYFLQEQSESVLTKCERSKDYRAKIKGGTVDWACWGGSMRLSPPHWDFEASSFLPPSLGSALTCLTLPTVTCQHQHSSSGETEESRGPAEYFWNNLHFLFQTTQQRWTKTVTAVYSQSDATISRAEKGMNKSDTNSGGGSISIFYLGKSSTI